MDLLDCGGEGDQFSCTSLNKSQEELYSLGILALDQSHLHMQYLSELRSSTGVHSDSHLGLIFPPP